MPLDALCLSGVVHELQNALSGAKIDKIYQPGRVEVVLALRLSLIHIWGRAPTGADLEWCPA